MKKTVIFAFLFLAIFSVANSEWAVYGKFYNLNRSGINDPCFNLEYDDEIVDGKQQGTTCEIVVIYVEKNCIITPSGNGLILEAQLDDGIIQYHVQNPDSSITNISRSKSFRHFGINEYLHISNCDEYPQLNGVEVNLYRIVTDINGNYQVYIPVHP
ncbi:MAG: hypothetical protein A2X64_00870 [Ignavibacteria bacterium GWF2_33_9]|nr:MAG: hypothetical protein A2X64_00870 [Ignavibacteria bacterium GWF2_33_9]